jgi:hypothetical protein
MDYDKEGFSIAWVIEETEHQYVVYCPYCGKKHYHGKVEGHRVAHCMTQTSETSNGYIVTRK